MRKSLYPVVIALSAALAACGSGEKTGGESPKIKAAPITPVAAKPALSPQEAMLLKGRRVYKRCSACHTLDEGGRHRVGPNLYGVIGAKSAAKDGFVYSSAMKAADLVWTDENLSGYLENPRKFMPKNKMSFAGLRKAEDREAVIAYIKSETNAQ